MKLGLGSEMRRAYSQEDIERYAALCGHVAPPNTVPDALVESLFSYLLGVKLPGPGTNYLKQQSQFHARAAVGDELLARVEIYRLRPEKHLVDLTTRCETSAGELICDGRALVYVRDVAQ
jgi:acyl dehydratase